MCERKIGVRVSARLDLTSQPFWARQQKFEATKTRLEKQRCSGWGQLSEECSLERGREYPPLVTEYPFRLECHVFAQLC